MGLIKIERVKRACLSLGERGVKMRYLTDMTEENLSYINLRNKVEENGMEEQKIGLIDESSRTRHTPVGHPTFGRILVAYDGMQMSKRALSYGAYISRISDSEIVVIKVVKANIDSNNILPITIRVNLQGSGEQIDLQEVVDES